MQMPGGFGGGSPMMGGGRYQNALVIHVEKVTDFTQDFDDRQPRLPDIEARVLVHQDGMGCFDHEKMGSTPTAPQCIRSGQPARVEGKDLIYEFDFVYYLNMAYKDGETYFNCSFHALHGSTLSYSSTPNGPFDLKIDKNGLPKTVEKFSSAYSGGTITWWATIYPPSEATGAPPAPKSNREQFQDKLSEYHAYVREHGEHPPQGHPMYCPPHQRARLGYKEDGTLAEGPPSGGGGGAGGGYPAGGPAGGGSPHGGRGGGGFGGMMGRFGGGGGGGAPPGQQQPQAQQNPNAPPQQQQPPQQQGGYPAGPGQQQHPHQGGGGFGGGMMGGFGRGGGAPPQQPPQQQQYQGQYPGGQQHGGSPHQYQQQPQYPQQGQQGHQQQQHQQYPPPDGTGGRGGRGGLGGMMNQMGGMMNRMGGMMGGGGRHQQQ